MPDSAIVNMTHWLITIIVIIILIIIIFLNIGDFFNSVNFWANEMKSGDSEREKCGE